MVEVIFNYEGINTSIQCNLNEKMKDIISKFLVKIDKKEKNIQLYYLYNGNQINNELTFNEQANNFDKNRNKMNIIVTDNAQGKSDTKKIISKDIVCPYCKENILIDIKNFKINLHGCKKNHTINKLLMNRFEETQTINLSKIICEICKSNNKGYTHNNEFYICNTCNKNICPLCKSIHNKKHKIINYDDKNFICRKHNEPFNKYCKTCNDNICYICENKHKGHYIFELGNILIEEDDLLKTKKDLKRVIDKFKRKIYAIKEILDITINLMDFYYKINDNIIENYNINKRNYHNLQNLNYLKNNSEKIIKYLNYMINNDNISEIFAFSLDNFYNENGEKYIGKMKNGLKEGEGLLYYEKDNEYERKKYEGDFKNDKPDGKGIMLWNFDDRYEGGWKNDVKEGKGIYFWKNGDKYEGDFKNGLCEGKGIYYWNDGNIYKGDWKSDKKEGKGKYYWNDGNIYEGDWKSDKKEGRGVYYFCNGDRYEGDFKKGKAEGKGVIYYKNGEIKKGNFKDNEYLGE